MDYKIISDGSCDLGVDLAKEYDVDVVPFYVSFDKETYYKEIEEIGIRDFYQRMVDNPKVFPKSSLPSIEDYINIFTKYVKEGKAVICICITTKFSGSYNSATNAKNIVMEEYEDAEITVIDSAINTVLQGLYVLEAAKMKRAGYTYGEVIENLERIKNSGRIFFTIGSIDYLKAGGRIGKLAGIAGTTLGLKPLIILKDGEINTGGITRSRKKSLLKVISLIEEHFKEIGESVNDYSFAIGYGYDEDEARIFKKLVLDMLNNHGKVEDLPLRQIGATIAVHTGPFPLGVGLIRRYDAK